MYGVLERQFRRYFAEAERRKGNTGANLLSLLESRLDNVVYRMGFGSTRAEARQLVSHRAITVNGKVVNIPSLQVKAGDVVSRSREGQEAAAHQGRAAAGRAGRIPDWVEVDAEQAEGHVQGAPDRDRFAQDINEALVVELYSK